MPVSPAALLARTRAIRRTVQRPLPAGARRYDPGAGPGFTAALPSGARTLEIPARALRDRFGNTHGEPIRVAR